MKWVSVKDKLPDNDQTVLVCDCSSEFSSPTFAWYEEDEDIRGFYLRGPIAPHYRIIVTHWMKVPPVAKKPKESS